MLALTVSTWVDCVQRSSSFFSLPAVFSVSDVPPVLLPRQCLSACAYRTERITVVFHVVYGLTGPQVLETCVKNCGHRFHVLVASQEFVEGVLVQAILPRNNPPTALHERVLSLIQVQHALQN